MNKEKILAIVVAIIVTLIVAVWAGSIYFTGNNDNTPPVDQQAIQGPQATSTPIPTVTPTPTPTPVCTVIVTGVNIQIQYENASDSYFGPVSQGLTLEQPHYFTGNQSVVLSFTLSEHQQETANHSINSITVTTPGFTFVSINPTVPIGFSPGSTTAMTVSLLAPESDYSGPVNLIINTS